MERVYSSPTDLGIKELSIEYVRELLALPGSRVLQGESFSRVVDVGDGLIVKYGHGVNVSDAIASEFVRRNTTIPVAEMVGYAVQEVPPENIFYDTWIVMKRVPGITLKSWLSSRPSKELYISLAVQLRAFLKQLSAFDNLPIDGFIRKGLMAPVYKDKYTCSYLRHIVILTKKEVSSYDELISWLEEYAGEFPEKPQPYLSLRASSVDKVPRFTHGDLLPENIMVSEDGCAITAIIDWGSAGWYPALWDAYINICRDHRSDIWLEMLPIIGVCVDDAAANAFARLMHFVDQYGP